jgi:hypothetical protein
VSEGENLRGMRQHTSAGVSVGVRRSPSYTNLSDPTRVNVGGTLVFGKCRGKRTRIFAEAFLKEGGTMSAWGLRRRSRTSNLSNLEYLFELHVCFYFHCDLYTKTVMDENTLVLSTGSHKRR